MSIIRHITYGITDFFFHVKRGFQFMKLGWKDHDWDYDYLLQLEKQKLEWMYRYFISSELSYNNKERANHIMLAIKLFDIIQCKDTATELKDPNAPICKCEFVQTKYINTRNWKRFIAPYDAFEKHINSPDSIGCIYRDNLRVEKAWYLYHKIRTDFMRNWWD